jgi:pimeloyl-ACP methyl ester carboxylesterase
MVQTKGTDKGLADMDFFVERAADVAFRTARFFAGERKAPVDYVHPEGPGKPLVAMLHGFAGQMVEFAALYAALHERTSDVFDFALVDNLNPGGGSASEENVANFNSYLTAHDLRGRELYLVGHSIGGLVVRQFTHQADTPSVRAAVLICTPNGGVNAANVLPWIGSHEFDARFNSRFPIRAGIPHFQLFGTVGANVIEGIPNDQAVGQWSAVRLLDFREPGAEVTVKGYPLDHWKTLSDPASVGDVVEFLLKASSSEP